MKTIAYRLSLICLLVLSTVPTSAEDTKPKRFEAADAKGVQAMRDGRSVYLEIDAGVKGPVQIPRLAAPLRSMVWQGHEGDAGIRLNPEPEHWVIRWNKRPAGATTLVLNFDDEPRLPSELKPVEAAGDGSFFLPAHLAITRGEKIRYEPQTFKNTVGYWTGKQDTATWTIKLDKPGRFAVAILQGCGKGQGGSTAQLSFEAIQARQANKARLDFTVEETGHFQNFKWRHLGEVELKDTGEIKLTVRPEQIKKAALIDIRAIHLVRLPNQ